ncbi:hypothetical protein TSAR_007036 [Trichomalopsis sarcophagae]|uniref:Uncharacterized protein n=1 Tax=Trichomalopsis sarcophagae TaxID=543379 RepID=A0A232ELX2_9HYME|nr:hypothetical protein TSAR_007036 [Trichomalopsis sarcophagae]
MDSNSDIDLSAINDDIPHVKKTQNMKDIHEIQAIKDIKKIENRTSRTSRRRSRALRTSRTSCAMYATRGSIYINYQPALTVSATIAYGIGSKWNIQTVEHL